MRTLEELEAIAKLKKAERDEKHDELLVEIAEAQEKIAQIEPRRHEAAIAGDMDAYKGANDEREYYTERIKVLRNAVHGVTVEEYNAILGEAEQVGRAEAQKKYGVILGHLSACAEIVNEIRAINSRVSGVASALDVAKAQTIAHGIEKASFRTGYDVCLLSMNTAIVDLYNKVAHYLEK